MAATKVLTPLDVEILGGDVFSKIGDGDIYYGESFQRWVYRLQRHMRSRFGLLQITLPT